MTRIKYSHIVKLVSKKTQVKKDTVNEIIKLFLALTKNATVKNVKNYGTSRIILPMIGSLKAYKTKVKDNLHSKQIVDTVRIYLKVNPKFKQILKDKTK